MASENQNILVGDVGQESDIVGVENPIYKKVPTESLYKLHNNLMNSNTGFNVPLDEFVKDMEDESNLTKLHSNLPKVSPDFAVPYDKFKSDMFREESDNYWNTTGFGRGVKVSGRGLAGSIGTAINESSIKLAKWAKNLFPQWGAYQNYLDEDIERMRAQVEDIKEWQEDVPELKGTFFEKVGGLVPLAGMVAATALTKSPTLARTTGTMFGVMGFGEGIQSYDNFKEDQRAQLQFDKNNKLRELISNTFDNLDIIGDKDKYVNDNLQKYKGDYGKYISDVYNENKIGGNVNDAINKVKADYEFSDEQIDDSEAERLGAGLLYGAVYSIPLGRYAGKVIPKGVYQKAMGRMLSSDPKALGVTGKAVWESFLKTNPSAAKKFAKQMLGKTGHSIATMETLELGKMAVDNWLIGRNVTPDEFWERTKGAVESGAMFAFMTAPFSMYAQDNTTKYRRRKQGSVTIGMNKPGESFEIVPDGKGGNIGIRPDGSIVEVSQNAIKNSIKIPTDVFEKSISESKRMGGKLYEGADVEAMQGNLKGFADRASYKGTDNLYTYEDAKTGEKYFIVDGDIKNAEAELKLVGSDGQLRTSKFIDRSKINRISKEDFIKEGMDRFNREQSDASDQSIDKVDAARETVQNNVKLLENDDGNIHQATDREGNPIFVKSETPGVDGKGGTAIVVDANGETRTMDVADIQNRQVIPKNDMIAEQLGQFEAEQEQSKQPETFKYNGDTYGFRGYESEDGEPMVAILDETGAPVGEDVPLTEKFKDDIESQLFSDPETEPEIRTVTIGNKEYTLKKANDAFVSDTYESPADAEKAFEDINNAYQDKNTVKIVKKESEQEGEPSTYQVVVKPIVSGEAMSEELTPELQEQKEQMETPSYKIGDKDVNRDYVEEFIDLADTKEELDGLTVNNDPEILEMIDKKFPEPVTSYKIGNKEVSRERAMARIELAKTPEQLAKLKVTADAEVEELYTKRATEFEAAKGAKELSKEDKKHNRLVQLVSVYNQATVPQRKRINTGEIMKIASDFGYNVADDYGKLRVTTKDGKKITSRSERQTKAMIDVHKSLNEYEKEFQDVANSMIEMMEGVDIGMTPKEVDKAVEDIKEGKKTVGANKLLDALEVMINDKTVKIKPDRKTGFAGTDIPLGEYLKIIDKDITPEDEVIMQNIPDEVWEQMAEAEDLTEYLNYIPDEKGTDETRTEKESVPKVEAPEKVAESESTKKEIADEQVSKPKPKPVDVPTKKTDGKEMVSDGVEVVEKPAKADLDKSELEIESLENGETYPIYNIGDEIISNGKTFITTTSNKPKKGANDYIRSLSLPYVRGYEKGDETKNDVLVIVKQIKKPTNYSSFAKSIGATEDIADILEGNALRAEINGVGVIINESDGKVVIESIKTPDDKLKQGLATKAMEKITSEADKQGIVLELDAIPEEGSEITTDQLKDFYSKFGFEFEGEAGVREVKAKPKSKPLAEAEKEVKTLKQPILKPESVKKLQKEETKPEITVSSAQSPSELQELLSQGKVKKDKVYDERMEELRADELSEPIKNYSNFEKDEIEKAFGSVKEKEASVNKTAEMVEEVVYGGWDGTRLSDKIKKRTVLEGFVESGEVNFIGQKINSPQDIADLWSIHRSPYIEKAHVIFIKNGEIVGSSAFTANKLDASLILHPKDVSDLYKKHGADGMYYLHNHPSGNHNPSLQDIYLTQKHYELLNGVGVNLIGHVIIDHKKFSYIPISENRVEGTLLSDNLERYLKTSVKQFDYKNKPPMLFTEREILGTGMGAAERMGEIAISLMNENNYRGAIIYLSPNLSVNAYDVFPENSTVGDINKISEIGVSNNLGSRVVFVHDGSYNFNGKLLNPKTIDVFNVKTRESDNFGTKKGKSLTEEDLITLWEDVLNYKKGEPRFKLGNDILKSLKDENKSTLPKIPTKNVFLNEAAQVPSNERKSVDEYIESGDISKLPVQEVSISDIIPTQKNLTIDNIESVSEVDNLPELLKYNGKYYVIDGHHRIANRILDGDKTVEAIIYNQEIKFKSDKAKKPSDFKTIPEYQEYRKGMVAENLKRTQELAKDIGDKLGVKVNVVEYVNDLPQHIKRASSKQGLTKTYGVYDPANGEVYLVAYNLEGDSKLITETALHETIGHKGFWSLLGNDGNKVLDLIWKGMNKADQEAYFKDNTIKDEKESIDVKATERLAAEEFMSDKAGKGKVGGWLHDIIARIRELVRKLFPQLRYNNADVLDLLRRSKQNLRKDAKKQAVQLDKTVKTAKLKAEDQTQTKAFKEWFKDSKIVDENGDPLVVYHGTNKDFNSFKSTKFSTAGYFSEDPVYAKSFARTITEYRGGNENVKSVYLKIEKPFDVSQYPGDKEYNSKELQEMFPIFKDKNIKYAVDRLWGWMGKDEIINILKDNGFDGVSFNEMSVDYWKENDFDNEMADLKSVKSHIAFSPTQIKSATGNIGTFDPNVNDIRFSGEKPTRIDKKEAEIKAKIAEFKRSTESITNHKLLRNKITALKAGYKMGILDERTNIKDVQNEITKYAKKYMPIDVAGKRDIGKLLTMVKNTQTPSKLEEIFDKIDEMTTGIQRKQAVNNIDKTLKRTEVKKVSGKIQGKLSPDVQATIEKIRSIRKLKSTDEYVDNLEDNDVEDIALFSVFGNLKDKSKSEVDKASAILNELVTTGKIWYKSEIEKRKKYQKELRDKVVDKVTGGKGLSEAQDIKAEGKDIGEWFNNRFINKNQSFEWLMDVISQDKTEKTGQGWMQDHFGDILNKATNAETKGHRTYVELLNDKASEIFGKEKSALAKKLGDNARQVEKSGVTYVKDGKRIELPLSQNEAYKKWMELQDPKLAKTFDRMGWDETTISQLENFIKPDVKKWAEWQLNEFYPEYYKTVNKEYRKNYFVDLPFNEKYSPITREVTDVKDADDPLLKNTRTLSSVGNASLKSRVSNVNPLAFKDGDNVLANHLAQMEHFKAWVEPMRELRTVFSSRPIQHALKFEHGNSIRNAINNQIDDFARGGIDRSLVISAIDKIRRNFVTAELGLNYGLLPKQLVSSFTYMADIPLSEYVKGMADFTANPMKVINTLKESELIKNRYKAGWTHEVESAMKTLAPETLAGVKTGMQQLRNVLMLPTKLGDRFAIYAGWPVYKYYYNQQIKEGKSEKDASEFAMNKFERVASRSQQSASLKDTSALQKGSLGKLFTMFHNSQQQYFRYEMAAIRNLAKGRGSVAHNLKILAVTHFLLPVLFQLVSNWFSDDDKETEQKRLWRAAILGSWNGLLIAGDIMEYGLEKLFGEKWGYTPSPLFGSVENLGYGMSQIAKYFDELDTEYLIKGVDNISHALSQTVIGAPYRPAKKLIKEVREIIDPGLKLEREYKKAVRESLDEMKMFNEARKERNLGDAEKISNSPTFEKSREVYFKNNLITKWASEIKELEKQDQTDIVIEGIKRKTEMRNNLMKELIEKTK